MSDIDSAAEQAWPRTCPVCGTDLATAVVDFDKTNADRPELRPGEMAAVDYCPNPDCPSHADDAVDAGGVPGAGDAVDAGPGATIGNSADLGPETGPGSLGGDNGGG
jgi:hypothetical protein